MLFFHNQQIGHADQEALASRFGLHGVDAAHHPVVRLVIHQAFDDVAGHRREMYRSTVLGEVPA